MIERQIKTTGACTLLKKHDTKDHLLLISFSNSKNFRHLNFQFDGQPKQFELKQEGYKSPTFACQHPEVLQPVIREESNLKEGKEEDRTCHKEKGGYR